MNHLGMFTSIMTMLLMLAVCGSAIRSSETSSNVWIGMRSAFYFAGVLVSGFYLNYLSGSHSASQQHLSWNNFVPLIFSVVGLMHGIVVRQTRPRIDGYTPQTETDELIFRDESSR